METALLSIAFAASLLGLLFAALVPLLMTPWSTGAPRVPPPDEAQRAWRTLFVACGACVLPLFLATLPTQPPWSPGQAMGWGFLIGGGIGLAGAALVANLLGRAASAPRATDLPPLWGGALGAALLALALLGVATVVLLWRQEPQDALNGLALGILLVGILGRLLLGLGAAAGGRVPDGLLLESWPIFAATLAATLSLGFDRFPADAGAMRLAPLGLVSVMVVALMAGSALSGMAPPGRAFTAMGALSVVTVGVLSALTLPRLPESEGALAVVLAGLATGVLVAGLAAGALPRGREPGEPAPYALEAGALMALMAVALFVVAFQWMQGYGVGMALLGAWAVGAPALAGLAWQDLGGFRIADFGFRIAPPGAAEPAVSEGPAGDQPGEGVRAAADLAAVLGVVPRFLAVGLLALLFRLFLTRYRPLATDLSLTVHFTLVGMAIGAVVPVLFAGGVQRALDRVAHMARGVSGGAPATGGMRGALRLALLTAAGLGVWSVALPAAVGVAWGMRTLVGVLAGLLVAGLYTLLLSILARRQRDAALVAGVTLLVLVAMALVMVQSAHLLGALGILHRTARVAVLAAVGLLGLVWVVVPAWRAGAPASEPALHVEG